METDVAKIKQDEINTNWSFGNLNTSVSLEMAKNSFYNVTPIESQIKQFVENSRTQSSITLTDDKLIINNSISVSRCSVNKRVDDTENKVTNSVSASGFLKELVEGIYNNTLNYTPQILFNASKPKRHKKIRRKTLNPKNRKSHRSVRLVTYIRHYKYKHSEKIILGKFKTYCNKTRRNRANASRIKQDIFSNSFVKAVSGSTILKKVLAKENLLNEVDRIMYKDIQQDKALEKDPSGDTLTRINSESSHNDSIHTKTPPSVVEIPNSISVTDAVSTRTITLNQNGNSDLSNESHETYSDNDYGKYNTEESINQSSFKTNIEVALALNDTSILKYVKTASDEQSREKMMYKENLTSAESFLSESDFINITSSQDTSDTDTQNMNLSRNENDKICIVINDVINTFNNTSDSDTFVIAQTSSYFKNTSDSVHMSSEQTLTPSSELTNQTEPCNIYVQPTGKGEVKTVLLDSNETICQMPVSCSSNAFSTENYLTNNVIITDELGRIPLANREPTADKKRNVMQKSFSVENDGDRPKNINLPNEDTIRAILEAEVEKKSCSEEFRNFIPQADVFDKLISFLDIAIKRMEDSLLKRIGNELKHTLDKFEKFLPLMEERDFVKSDMKLNSTNENKRDLSRIESGDLTVLEEGVQCGLVKNEIIDELTKMKIEGESNAECPVQITESKVMIKKYEDSFKVLKPIELCTSDGDHGESYITSSSEGVRVKNLRKKSSLLSYLAAPIHFVKTNILVLTSVPAFFFSVYLLYSFFLLLV